MTKKNKGRVHVERTSPDILSERLGAFRELFPEVFTEGKVDLDKLRKVLGDEVEDRPERYSFTWAGKREAIKILQVPSRATLVPAKEESIDWETTNNVFIEGENLEVLKLLYRSYAGRVKMIYIDPPYNTGNDFIYPDNFSDPLDTYLKITGQKDSEGNLQTSNPETSGRYHSAWLSMMYPRLFLARQLLREDGVIFISIDDNEVHNLRVMMNEVFGEENFVASIIWKKIFSPKNTAKYFSEDHDYIIVYARNKPELTLNPLPRSEKSDERYSSPDNDPRGPWSSSDLTARNYYSEGQYEVTSPSGKKFKPTVGAYWRVNYEKFKQLDEEKRIWWGEDGGNMPRLKRFISDVMKGRVPQTLWTYDEVGHTQEAKQKLLSAVKFEKTENVLDTVKPPRLLKRMLTLSTNTNDGNIVLDFFAGSAPLAQAVLEQNREDGGNRRFVCVQLPHPLEIPEKLLKTIADIAKQRISNVIKEMKDQSKGTLELKEKGRDGEEDLGFRTYRLNESNYQSWSDLEEKDSEKYAGLMERFHDPLKQGWKVEDVIWQTAIGEGYVLNSRIGEEKGIRGLNVFRVTDPDKEQTFRICLDGKLKLSDLKKLGLGKEDLFICRDAALDDEAAANLALQCRLKTI